MSLRPRSRSLPLGSLALSLWLTAFTLGAAPRAGAQESASEGAAPRDLAAREAFAAGRYQDAVDLFAKLYAEGPHPNYLHNIGRCYQNLGEPDLAIASFREFLRKASALAPETRAQVEGYITEMEQLKEARAEAQTRAAAPVPPPSADAPGLQVAVNELPAPPQAAPVRPADPAPRAPVARGPRERAPWQRPLAFGLLGAGVTSLGLGGFFGVRSLRSYDDAQRDCPSRAGCSAHALAARDDAQREAWISNTTFAAGTVLAVTGTVLLFTWSRKRRATAAEAAPPLSLHAQPRALMLRGTF